MSDVVIVGASFAGLLAAAAAALAGHEVTLLERDELPVDPAPRRGVPQGRQPHVLLRRGLLAMESLLPGLERELLEAGGVRFNTGSMPWLGEYGWLPRGDHGYEIVSLTRPRLEHLVRGRVAALPRIRFSTDVAVSGLRHDHRGWDVMTRGGPSHRADIVVDASGRRSRLPVWLADAGLHVPEPASVDAGLGYASRTYRGAAPLTMGVVVAATPGAPTGALALPVEQGRWLVCAVGYGDLRPTRDVEEFTPFLSRLRDPWVADLVDLLEPDGDVAIHSSTANRRFAYGRSPQLGVLTLEPFHLSRLLRGDARPGTVVDLGLPHPLADGLRGRHPEQLRDSRHRRPVRLMIRADLNHHPHRPLLQLQRGTAYVSPGMTPTFPRFEVSGHPGAVQSGASRR